MFLRMLLTDFGSLPLILAPFETALAYPVNLVGIQSKVHLLTTAVFFLRHWVVDGASARPFNPSHVAQVLGRRVWSSSPGADFLFCYLLSTLGKPLKRGKKKKKPQPQRPSFLKIEKEGLVGDVLGFWLVLSDTLSPTLSAVICSVVQSLIC